MFNYFKHKNKFLFTMIIICSVLLFAFLLPEQANYQTQLDKKNTELAQAYSEQPDSVSSKYTDATNIQDVNVAIKIERIQNEVKEIETAGKYYLIVYWIVLSLLAGTIASLLATWMQFIFTRIDFADHYDKDKTVSNIFASALFSATLIVITVLYLVFNQ